MADSFVIFHLTRATGWEPLYLSKAIDCTYSNLHSVWAGLQVLMVCPFPVGGVLATTVECATLMLVSPTASAQGTTTDQTAQSLGVRVNKQECMYSNINYVYL